MVLKIHGFAQSTCTQRVLTVVNELAIKDYELVVVNLYAGEQTLPGHIALHPFGKIPVLEDDGYFVYESRAICKYLALKYYGQGTNLISAPGDLKAYGMFEQVSYSVVCSILRK
jgi:glutathione S-transferase